MQASLGFGASLQQLLVSVHKLNVDECWKDGLLRSGLLFLATLEADQAQGVKVSTTPSTWASVPHLHSLVINLRLVQRLLISTYFAASILLVEHPKQPRPKGMQVILVRLKALVYVL